MEKRKQVIGLGILALCLAISLTIIGVAWSNLSAGSFALPSNSPTKFRVVYFGPDTGASVVRAKAPTLLKAALGAETAKNWQAVMNADRAKQIDALVIDKSALSRLNAKDLKQLYARGTLIAAFDVPAVKLAALLDDPCITQDNFGLEPYSGSAFFVSVSQLIQGTPKDVAWVNNVYGATTHIQGGYSAFTYSPSQAPYIEVYMKSWGACCPRYQGGASNGKYNAYTTNTVKLSDIYWTYTTRHLTNTQYGGIEFYTSDNGAHSTFCWWNNGKATC